MALLLPVALPEMETVTGRFILRPFTPKDVGPLAAILLRDEIWSQGYGGGEFRPVSPAELAGFIQRRYEGRLIFSVFRVDPGRQDRFIGTTGVTDVQAERECATVGRTVFDPAVWGTRANHEVKVALLDWLFSCGAGRIECEVDACNQRSLRSLVRFGFTVEGTRRRSAQRVDGSWRDIVILSLLTEEWPEARRRVVSCMTGSGDKGLQAA